MSDISLVHICPVPETGDLPMETYLQQIPLGPLSLATYLSSVGVDVDFRDYSRTPGRDPMEAGTFLSFLGEPAEVIGLSSLSVALPFVVLIAEELKKRYPYKKILLGGMGPSHVAEELMKTFPFIDCILCGEGELALARLLQERFSHPEDIAGLVYRDADGVIRKNPVSRIEDLDILPIPDYRLLDFSSYPGVNSHIVTMRGCPFRCIFCCCSHFWGSSTTMRSLEKVMEEIRVLASGYGQRVFRIEDDIFIADRNRVRQFCSLLRQENIPGLRWSCMGRIDLVDEELLSWMAEAGCASIYFGLESGSDEVRQMLGGKGFTFKKALEVLRLTRSYIPGVTASFLWGFPFESYSQFMETIKAVFYLEEKEICDTRLSLVIPFPGTPLFERCRGQLSFSDRIINHKMRYYLRDNTMPLIEAHPCLFSAYYFIDAPDMEKKCGFFERHRE